MYRILLRKDFSKDSINSMLSDSTGNGTAILRALLGLRWVENNYLTCNEHFTTHSFMDILIRILSTSYVTSSQIIDMHAECMDMDTKYVKYLDELYQTLNDLYSINDMESIFDLSIERNGQWCAFGVIDDE